MPSTIVGIDIGSESVRAVELSDSGRGRPTLHRFHELNIPPGAVVRGEVQQPHTIATALKQLWARGSFKTKKAVIGVGNQKVIARDISVPRAPIDRIRETLPLQVQDMLPVPVTDALLDFYPVSESHTEHGPQVHGLLIAAIKEAVFDNVKAVQGAGLYADNVDLIPFALVRSLIPRATHAGTVAIVDLGSSATTVVVATDGVPQFVRIIPSGSGDLTLALAQSLEVASDEAERVKHRLGLAKAVANMQEHKAIQVIYEVTNEVLASLRNTVSYFTNVHPETPVQSIVVTGGGAALPGFMNALADITRIPVSLGDPFTNVVIGKGIDQNQLLFSRSTLAVAVGLALRSAA